MGFAVGGPQIDLVGNVLFVDHASRLPIGDIFVQVENLNIPGTWTKSSNGFYRVRVPYEQAIDHQLVLLFSIGKKVLARSSVWILDDGRLGKRDGLLIYKVDDTVLEQDASSLKQWISDDLRGRLAPEGLDTAFESSASPGSLLAYLFTLAFVLPMAPPTETIVETNLPMDKVDVLESGIGQLFRLSRNREYPAYGFRYSPGRRLLPAVTTNPAALALEPGVGLGSNLFWDLSRQFIGNLEAYYSVDGWSLGIAGLASSQNVKYGVTYDAARYLKSSYQDWEYAVLVNYSHQVFGNFSLGISGKVQIQNLVSPDHVHRIEVFRNDPFTGTSTLLSSDDDVISTDSAVTTADIDLSSALDILPNIRLGVSLLSLLGSRVPTLTGLSSDRTFGFGVTYFARQLQAGGDIEYNEDTGLDGSCGVSFSPIDDFELSLGALFGERVVQVTVRYRSLSLAYRYSPIASEFSINSELHLPAF